MSYWYGASKGNPATVQIFESQYGQGIFKDLPIMKPTVYYSVMYVKTGGFFDIGSKVYIVYFVEKGKPYSLMPA